MKRNSPASKRQENAAPKKAPKHIVPPGHGRPIPYPSLRYDAYVAAKKGDFGALEKLVDPISREFDFAGFCWEDYVVVPAMSKGRVEVVEWLREKMNPSSFDARFRGRLLKVAIDSHNLPVFQWLCKSGVDTTLTLYCVNRMAMQNQTRFVEWILDSEDPAVAGIWAQFEEHRHKRFVCLAIERDSADIIRLMHERGKLRWTPLMCYEAIRCKAKGVYRFMHTLPRPICDTPGCVMLREFYEEEY